MHSEQSPSQIILTQGSLWGLSPRAAKKAVTLHFESVANGTQVTCTSKLSSDWKNLTLGGCVLALVVMGVCLWMATDLSSFMVSREHSFWSWLVTSEGNMNLQAGQTFVSLTWGLAIFLSLIVLVEIAILCYAQAKIDVFAQEALNELK